mgnify:FL=1
MTGIRHDEALRAVQLGASLHGLALDDDALQRVALQWEQLTKMRELLDACPADVVDDAFIEPTQREAR